MKKPRRFGQFKTPLPDDPGPAGSYLGGIRNDEFAKHFGKAIADWSLLEDQMIALLGVLLGPDETLPARQIYRTFAGAAQRIKLMRTLLQETEHNFKRGPEYDLVISDFEVLNRKRNAYVHGLWWTHDSGEMFLQPESDDDYSFLRIRAVPQSELTGFADQLVDLHNRILQLRAKR